MSFLHRLALKSIMAAKKESVVKCAGDGANTMMKTTQNLAKADTSRVLVALDLKAAFPKVSRRAMLYNIEQTDADLAAVFSKWYTGTTENRMHYDSANTKISANNGVDQGCPLSTCDFSAAVDLVLRYPLAHICRLHDPGAKIFAHLDDWYLWIKPQNLVQTVAIIAEAPDQSTWPYSPPRHRCGEPLARTPFHLSFKTKSNSHSAVWEDIFKLMATSNPALLFWDSRPPWRKQHNRELPPHLRTSMPTDSMRRQ